MSLFDLVFMGVTFATLISLTSSGILLLRGRRGGALRRLGRLATGLSAYMAVVTVASLLAGRRVLALGEDQCSDDWCVAVVAAMSTPMGPDTQVDVDFRLSSRALRVSQRERFVVAYVLDAQGGRYDVEPVGSEIPFDTLLGPGDSVRTTRRFRVPSAAHELGVVVAREGDLAFPRCCILGQGPFFKYPIVDLGSIGGS